MKKKKIILLLTGAVEAAGVDFVKRNNSKDRLHDYKQAINKWIKHKQLKIVFVENTNFPEEYLGLTINNHINFEYLTYDGRDYSIRGGKGYGEINSIEFASRHSQLFKEADYIIKCTGRYYFKNILSLIKYIEKTDVDIIANFRKDLNFMDSRVFVFKPLFFHNYFLKYKNQIDDTKGLYFEHALSKATHELLSQGGKWCSIPIPLLIEGVSGTSNIRHDRGINRLKVLISFYLKNLIC